MFVLFELKRKKYLNFVLSEKNISCSFTTCFNEIALAYFIDRINRSETNVSFVCVCVCVFETSSDFRFFFLTYRIFIFIIIRHQKNKREMKHIHGKGLTSSNFDPLTLPERALILKRQCPSLVQRNNTKKRTKNLFQEEEKNNIQHTTKRVQ